MRFSQRIGIKPIKTELEKDGLSEELRNSLWTLILELILKVKSNEIDYDQYGHQKTYTELSDYYRDLWIHFFKWPIDNLAMKYGGVADPYRTNERLREWFFNAEWDAVFDFIEFSSTYHNKFTEICNNFLKKEMSAYRFVEGNLVQINSKEEVVEVQAAIKNSDKFNSVNTHLKTALELLSDRKNPDYRNSIKESISAVESLSKIIIKNDKTTLGQALKEIEKKHQIPGGLKAAFTALYGYTSEEGGIRHGLLDNDIKIEIEEARFMLIACSAFVNYLICKI
jgi:hypothetical protein